MPSGLHAEFFSDLIKNGCQLWHNSDTTTDLVITEEVMHYSILILGTYLGYFPVSLTVDLWR